MERDVFQDGAAGVVFEDDVVEAHVAADFGAGFALRVAGVFGGHAAQFADAVEAGEGFGDLRADRGDRDDRGGDDGDIGEMVTKYPVVMVWARIARPPTTIINMPMAPTMTVVMAMLAEMPVMVRATSRKKRSGARFEDALLALFGDVGLHVADAAERLGEAAGDFGVDFAALAEERAQVREGVGHAHAEDDEDRENHQGQRPVEIKEDGEAEGGADHAADELDDAGADQVADAFGVGHDARDERAGNA